MTRLLLASASVHATAAACDYLEDRLGEDDAVRVITVAGDDPDAARDGADATNVARARLAGATVETETRTGEPGPEILAAASEWDADEVLVGARGGEAGPAGGATSSTGVSGGDSLGATAATVVGAADRPVVVVPLDGP